MADKAGARPVEMLTDAERRFERIRRTVGLWLGPLCFLVVLALPLQVPGPDGGVAGPGLTVGHRLAAVLALVVVFWVCESIPIPATALLGALLCVLMGIDGPKAVLAPFADPVIFLFLGSFMLAAAMTHHGLDRRLALTVLGLPIVAGSPWRLVGTLGLVAMVSSMWISNTATTAMLFPLALGLLAALREAGGAEAGKGQFATGMMLMVAYASSVGGIATPVGTPPNLIGLGQLHKLLGVDIPFFQWMQLALPITLATFVYLFVLMRWLHRDEKVEAISGEALDGWLADRRRELPPWTRGEINTCAAFFLAVTLWLLPGVFNLLGMGDSAFMKLLDARLPDSMVALLAALLLFFLPTDWKNREFTLDWGVASRIDWGTILLFGGGLALGSLMFSTGLAQTMGGALTDLVGPVGVWPLTLVAIVISLVLSETTSNTAAATMLIPVIIALAEGVGVNPVPPALGATLAASYAFMLPVSTPPNAIVFGSGLVPIGRMLRAGALLNLGGVGIIYVGLRVMCPLLGLG